MAVSGGSIGTIRASVRKREITSATSTGSSDSFVEKPRRRFKHDRWARRASRRRLNPRGQFACVRFTGQDRDEDRTVDDRPARPRGASTSSLVMTRRATGTGVRRRVLRRRLPEARARRRAEAPLRRREAPPPSSRCYDVRPVRAPGPSPLDVGSAESRLLPGGRLSTRTSRTVMAKQWFRPPPSLPAAPAASSPRRRQGASRGRCFPSRSTMASCEGRRRRAVEAAARDERDPVPEPGGRVDLRGRAFRHLCGRSSR